MKSYLERFSMSMKTFLHLNKIQENYDQITLDDDWNNFPRDNLALWDLP
jgi:hypothetical protein